MEREGGDGERGVMEGEVMERGGDGERVRRWREGGDGERGR